MTTRAQRARDGAAERWNDAAGPPDGPPRSLEETLEAWQRDAVVLRRHGHVFGLRDRVTGPGQRTRDDDLAIHRATLSTMPANVR